MLELVYEPEADKLAGVLKSVDGLSGRALRVEVQTDRAALLVIGLVEQDGSIYRSLLSTEAGAWRQVEVPLAEFSLSDETSDENARLDPAQVGALFIADAAGFHPDGRSGARALRVARCELVEEPAPVRPAAAESPVAGPRFSFEEDAEG